LIQNTFFDWHGLCFRGDTAFWRAYQPQEENTMFEWAVTFLVIAIIAGIFGFAGLAGTAAWIAKVLFVVGLVVFLVLLVSGRRPPAL
jgi:uncharacterized membrane protein YtjA (UPF0391 family)